MMEIIFVLMIGVVIGSTVPLILSKNEQQHLNYSIIMTIAAVALALVTGLIMMFR